MALIVLHVYFGQGGSATSQAFANPYMDVELHLLPFSIGLVTGVGQFLAILTPLLHPRLARRHSNGWILMVTTLGMGVSLLPMALIPHWAAVGLGRLGILTLSGLWMPALQVFQMELVDEKWRSLAYGAVSLAMGSSFASVSLGGGYLIASAGYRSIFWVGMVLCAAGTAVMWGILRHTARVTARS